MKEIVATSLQIEIITCTLLFDLDKDIFLVDT